MSAIGSVRGESQANVSRDLGVAESTLRGWLKEVTRICSQHRRNCPDTDVYKWFVQQQQGGVPLSGPILSAQVEKFDRELNGVNSLFKVSAGWLWRFTKRHGIGQITLSGEIRSADDNATKAYPDTLREIIAEGNKLRTNLSC